MANHHTRATLRCDDVFTTLDLLWDMHAAPTVVENVALRNMEPPDRAPRATGRLDVDHWSRWRVWNTPAAAYGRQDALRHAGSCRSRRARRGRILSPVLHVFDGSVVGDRERAATTGYRPARGGVERRAQQGRAGAGSADGGRRVSRGGRTAGQQANSLRELRLAGPRLHRSRGWACRVAPRGLLVATHDECRPAHHPGRRAAYEQKRCLHQLRIDLFDGGDALVTAAQLDGWEIRRRRSGRGWSSPRRCGGSCAICSASASSTRAARASLHVGTCARCGAW